MFLREASLFHGNFCVVSLGCVISRLSVPVHLIAGKDSFPKWPVRCQVGC